MISLSVMTIRDWLRERVSQFNRKCIPVSGLALLSAIYSGGNIYLRGLSALIIVGAVATFVVIMRQAPCPRCARPLGNVALQWRSNRLPSPRCLHCGLSIDEPTKPGSSS